MNQKRTEWNWADVDPLTRSVVAGLTMCIGTDGDEGELSPDVFVGAMTETFSDITAEDVERTAYWSGGDGIANLIINKLTGFEDDTLKDLGKRISTLAGGAEEQITMAEFGTKLLKSGTPYGAIPMLRAVSRLALNNLSISK